jgi:VanZ family protein
MKKSPKGPQTAMSLYQSSRFRIVAFVAWCLVWLVLPLIMLKPLPFGFVSRTDLLAHFLLFAVMTIGVLAFIRSRSQIVVLGLLSIGYGLALEVAQAFVPGRTFDVADMLANAVGGITGSLCALILFGLFLSRPATARLPSHSRAW